MLDNKEPKKDNVLERFLFIGRPFRNTTISTDEILNIKIALETTKDVKDFINVL